MPSKHICLLLLITSVACGRPRFARLPSAVDSPAQTGEAAGARDPVETETEEGSSDPTIAEMEEGNASPVPPETTTPDSPDIPVTPEVPVPGDLTGPNILSRFPAPGDNERAANLSISVKVNEAIDAASFGSSSFFLKRGSEEIGAVAGYDSSTRTLTLKPNERLLAGETYTVTLTKAIKDLSGNPLAADESWSFTVAAAGWAWISGSDLASQASVHGNKGIADGANTPGARQGSFSWFDSNGKYQLFAGAFANAGGAFEYNADVWTFDGNWTWTAGSNATNQAGIYGNLDTPADANAPGSRCCGVSARQGNSILIFGGNAYDANGIKRYANDLWTFDGKQWTWISGSSIGNQNGVYGNKGIAAAGNKPGGRQLTTGTLDRDGNLLIFGGHAYLESGINNANDLWKWNGSQWTWMAGGKAGGEAGVYGLKGVAAVINNPGARNGAVSWSDKQGNFYVFGGVGIDATGAGGDLNDLWKWNGSQWTWISGSNLVNPSGNYGSKGVAVASNVPGGRAYAQAAVDSYGHVYVFGGRGRDANGTQSRLNDLWKWDGSNWTWISGNTTIDGASNFGTKGSRAPANTPGARFSYTMTIDAFDNIWIFGGTGRDKNGLNADLNDLWRYTP